MRIVFDLLATNLGPNGGSHTLVRSGNTLVDMGHEVIFVDDGKCKYNWTPFKFERTQKIPSNIDVTIATGIKSVPSLTKFPSKLLTHWIRAHETWVYPEDQVINIIRSSPSIKIVNSICLKDKLKQFEIDSTIIRPGYDYEELYPMNIRSKNHLVIGGLYNEGKTKARKRTHWIFETVEKLKKDFPDIKLFMFGTDGTPENYPVDYFSKNPTAKDKNFIYNVCDIWLAPTNSEGLHLTPAEAMLTECVVLGTTAELSGMQDYLINNETGYISIDSIESFYNYAKLLCTMSKDERAIIGKNARDKILSLGDRKTNMQRLIDFLEGEIK